MYVFKARNGDGSEVVGIGISRKTLHELLQGETKTIPGARLGLPVDILILGGETDNSIVQRTHANMPAGSLWLPSGNTLKI